MLLYEMCFPPNMLLTLTLINLRVRLKQILALFLREKHHKENEGFSEEVHSFVKLSKKWRRYYTFYVVYLPLSYPLIN